MKSSERAGTGGHRLRGLAGLPLIPHDFIGGDHARTAGLNAIDNGIAAGMMAEMMEHAYPLVLGRDAAGVVEATGPGVTGITSGEEVFGHVLLAPPIQAGTLAEYALLPAAGTAPKPAGLDWVTAAALPLAGAAASAAVDAVDPRPGDVVLLVGAAGGVGSYAIQLLAAKGATVLATGTPGDTERLKGLGAATVLDYTAASVADQVRASYPGGIDALIDLARAARWPAHSAPPATRPSPPTA